MPSIGWVLKDKKGIVKIIGLGGLLASTAAEYRGKEN